MIVSENPTSAAIAFVAAIAAGIVIDQVLYTYVRARASERASSTGMRLASALHWLPTALGVVVGVSLVMQRVQLSGAAERWLPDVPRVFGIIVFAAFSARIAGGLIRAVTSREDVPVPSSSIFINLARATIWIIAVLAVLATIGISVTPLITALGVGGLAVGLALQPTLENLFSGIQLIASRQVEPGDFIRLPSGEEGTVLDITWRHTTVHRPSNEVVIVPNSVLSTSTVSNFSRPNTEYVLLVPVTLSAAQDLDAAERVALQVAAQVVAEVEGAVRGSEPGARLAQFEPPAALLNVTIRCTGYQERVAVRHEFIRRLARRFAEEGIEGPPVPLGGPRA